MNNFSETSPQPGQKWLVRLQPIDTIDKQAPEATVTLKDFDARTDTWTVQLEDEVAPQALPASCLIRVCK
jgi:hypothetical protein